MIGLGNIHVLIDSKKCLRRVEDLLSTAGYNIFTSTSRKELLKRAVTNNMKLLIISSKRGSGECIAICDELRAVERFKNTPAIIILDNIRSEDIQLGANNSILDFIEKDFIEELFLFKVKYAIAAGTQKKEVEELEYINQQKDELIKKYESEIADIKEKESRYLSIMAHDLKSYISGGLQAINILARKGDQWESRDAFFSSLANNTRFSLSLLNDLIVWGKAYLRKMVHEPISVNLNVAFTVYKKHFEVQLQKKRIKLDLSHINNIAVEVDRNILDTICNKLLDNAIKYSQTEAEINVSASNNRDGLVEICIADEGVGMREELLENLFSINNVVSEPGTSGEKGNGLSLQIVKELVNISKGDIWAESIPGVGSKVYFTLPQSDN